MLVQDSDNILLDEVETLHLLECPALVILLGGAEEIGLESLCVFQFKSEQVSVRRVGGGFHLARLYQEERIGILILFLDRQDLGNKLKRVHQLKLVLATDYGFAYRHSLFGDTE